MRRFSSPRGRNRRGSVLLTCVVLLVLFAGLVIAVSSWSWHRNRSAVLRIAAQHAKQYADSGVNAAALWLKLPSLKQNLASGTSSFSLAMPNGRADVALIQSPTTADLVDAVATGYAYLAAGETADAQTGRASETAVIRAKFRVVNVSEYLMAVPGQLQIAYGATTCPALPCSGILYGSSIQFQEPTGGGPSPAEVGTVDYFLSDGVSYSTPPVNVVFNAGPPQQLPYAPSFAALDAGMRSQYSPLSVGVSPADFEGTPAVPEYHVYYVPGDVDIGKGGPLTVQGVYVIYSTGTVYIHNSIVPVDASSWIGVLAENDIRIAGDAPDSIALNGNFICNGMMSANLPANGQPHPNPSQLALNGGIVTMSSISLSTAYANRSYAYYASNDPNLFLPNIAVLLQYTVSGGLN